MTALLTIPEASALLAISPATLRRWCSQGRSRLGFRDRFVTEEPDMTYGPSTKLNDLRPGAVFEDEHGDRYVMLNRPNNGGWISVVALEDGYETSVPQEFMVREILLDAPPP